MKSPKHIFLSITLLFFSASIQGQIDLSSLENLGSVIGNGDLSDQQSDNDSIDRGVEESFEKDRKLLEQDSTEENFGYSQTQSFINPPQEKFFNEPLKRFGYDLFIDAPTTFAPASDIPIPPDYIIGPGDNIKIIFFGNKNQKATLQVNREGEIFFPELGPISVAGLKFSEMKETITQIIDNQYIGTQINISLGELRSINVFLLGEVFQPGLYTISSLSTLTNALFSSGGIKSKGSLRNIQLKRKGKTIAVFDFYDLLLEGDISKDSTLMPGDVIFVPSITKTVAIAGEVRRPGIYELKEEETLDDLIKYSGSFSPKADIKNIEIQSIDQNANGFLLSDINYSKEAKTHEIKNGDLVSVFQVIDTMNKAVLVMGHAQMPGFYPWKEGMLLSEIINTPSDLLPMTDLNFGLIKRENESGSSFDVIQFDLAEIFSGEERSLELYEKDEIILFPKFLSPDLITAELIGVESLTSGQKRALKGFSDRPHESMVYQENNPTQQNYPPPTYEQTIPRPTNQTQSVPDDDEEDKPIENDRFYQYKIYNYCEIPSEIAETLLSQDLDQDRLVELGLLDESKKRSDRPEKNKAEELGFEESYTTSSDNTRELNTTIDKESILTDICRRDLLKPVVDMVNRNLLPLEPRKMVTIYGNVFFPGEYPYSSKMNIGDLIKAAGGLKDNTYAEGIEIISTRVDGKQNVSRFTDSPSSLKDTVNLQVKPLDVVNVKKISSDLKMVSISGEVFFPGDYPISKNESLRDLLLRAGGLKNQAFAQGAIFQRESLKEAEAMRLEKARIELQRKVVLATTSGGVGQAALQGDASSIIDKLLTDGSISEELAGRLVLDLEGIISGKEEDVILEDGDSIFIPQKQQTVSVLGEVYAPNAHLFKDIRSIQEYIDLSGGTNEYADQENTYIIKADGSIIPPDDISSSGFFRVSSNSLEPGDAIVVPLKVSTFSALKASTEISQIVYQMAIAAAAVNSF